MLILSSAIFSARSLLLAIWLPMGYNRKEPKNYGGTFMRKKWLLRIWGLLFVLCSGLGFLPEPQGAAEALLKLASLCFFIPPFLLLRRAKPDQDRDTVLLIRNLSALSLVLLAANFLSVLADRRLGDLLYCMLVIVSSPMICSGFWALSLFLWACLLVLGEKYRKSL